MIVLRKIRKVLSMNLFQKDDCSDKGLLDGIFVAVQEKVGIW